MKNKLYYISIEESESVYIVYKDCVFSTKEKCMDLYKWAVNEYGEDKVEICNFELNPSIGKFRIKEELK